VALAVLVASTRRRGRNVRCRVKNEAGSTGFAVPSLLLFTRH
jgi:hypothetical protein